MKSIINYKESTEVEMIWIKCIFFFQRLRLYILNGILKILFLIHSGDIAQAPTEKFTSKLCVKDHLSLIHLLVVVYSLSRV